MAMYVCGAIIWSQDPHHWNWNRSKCVSLTLTLTE